MLVSHHIILFQGDPAPPGAPWPWPKEYQPSPDLKTWNPDGFSFTSDVSGCDVIDKAFERYAKIIKLMSGGKEVGGEKLSGVHVTVSNKTCFSGYYPSFTSDEKCQCDNII